MFAEKRAHAVHILNGIRMIPAVGPYGAPAPLDVYRPLFTEQNQRVAVSPVEDVDGVRRDAQQDRNPSSSNSGSDDTSGQRSQAGLQFIPLLSGGNAQVAQEVSAEEVTPGNTAPVNPLAAAQSAVQNEALKPMDERSGAGVGAEPEKTMDNPKGLTEAELEQVKDLKTRDAEVRAHEQAHARVGGQYAGSPTYDYQRGPDNKRYAVGGSVSIDISPEATPEETIRKMEVVKRAALAPAEPSGQDRRVAAQADQIRAEAVQEQATQRRAEQAEQLGQAQDDQVQNGAVGESGEAAVVPGQPAAAPSSAGSTDDAGVGGQATSQAGQQGVSAAAVTEGAAANSGQNTAGQNALGQNAGSQDQQQPQPQQATANDIPFDPGEANAQGSGASNNVASFAQLQQGTRAYQDQANLAQNSQASNSRASAPQSLVA